MPRSILGTALWVAPEIRGMVVYESSRLNGEVGPKSDIAGSVFSEETLCIKHQLLPAFSYTVEAVLPSPLRNDAISLKLL